MRGYVMKKICVFGLIILFILGGCSNSNNLRSSESKDESFQHSVNNAEESIEVDKAVSSVSPLKTSPQDVSGEIIPTTANSIPEKSNDDSLYDLDKKFNEEINKTNGVTSEMVDVLLKYSALWKEDMNQYYDLLMEVMDEEGKAMLSDSQAAWEEYSQKNHQLILHCNSMMYEGGGSYLEVLEAELDHKKYRERAVELEDLYEITREISEENY